MNKNNKTRYSIVLYRLKAEYYKRFTNSGLSNIGKRFVQIFPVGVAAR